MRKIILAAALSVILAVPAVQGAQRTGTAQITTVAWEEGFSGELPSDEPQKTPVRAEMPFKSGEKLEFTASFQAPMWPKTNMAKLTVEVSDEMLDGGIPSYRISAYARTTFARWIYKMDSHYNSWLRLDGIPIKASTEISENSYLYNNDYTYDFPQGKVYLRWSKPGRYEDVRDTLSITDNARDIVSLMYHFRSVDADTMEVGADMNLELITTNVVKNVKYRFLGREVKKIKGFGEVPTLHFSCEMTMRDGTEFEKGSDLHIWISDDRNRLPLWIESPIRWGHVSAGLDSFKNLKFPKDSVLK